ncbi:HlyD family type I secretion periplasmic adaptor subunit [Pseudooceanicola nitratireducens]|uniref:HlyD family type I secretion periplasmic adaptor subunit n=1 Tax=Pseudooceanicola nitratireducens TaxID=517719 RepID=UPI001C941159|nr:HlyD family type I secretion periplasmic adaptor subunit [Pseudooceanicola nitratireducens]MBY6157744.1 HlyD family type I secretion periplasmic adaptor subunit [Pseudooceanicola nitratireducens]
MSNETSKSWSAKTPLIVGALTIFALVGGFGVWSVFTKISGAVIASGQLEVDRNRQVVQHLDGGVVTQILVDEGDRVEAGQLLIRLDDTQLRSQLAIAEGQLFELMARRGRLEAERDGRETLEFDPLLVEAAATREEPRELMDGQSRLAEARRESLEKEIEQLEKRSSQIDSQIEGIDAQRQAMSEQLELIQDELADQQSLLDRGLAQASRVSALRRENSSLSGSMGELGAQRAQAEGRITEIEIEILKLDTTRREEAITRLRDLQYRELELKEQRRALLEQLNRLDVTAPVGGVVYGLQVYAERSVLRPADPVLYIVPQDRPLIIAARVEPIHIDQLHMDQPVTLRFSAFDQRTTPELEGHVVQISADAFVDEATGRSYYRTEVELNEGELAKLPQGSILIPGMPVEAFIKTRERTPMAYFMEPFMTYFAKAFREA